MSITALILAEPPEIQQMPTPQSYAEAREALYVSGLTLFNVIQDQPGQRSNAQLTTAEVISGIGEGLALVAENTAERQGQPEIGDIQFSLNIGGELQLAFSEHDYLADSTVCYAVERWLHAAYWWMARESLTDSSSTDQLISQYHVERSEWARNRDTKGATDAIQEALSLTVSEMFTLEGGQPLFERVRISWRGADACLDYARQKIREQR